MIVGILALLALLLGGGGLNSHLTQIDDPVKEYVQDSEKQKAIIDASNELEDQMSEIMKAYSAEAEVFVDLNNSYAAKPEDFDQSTIKLMNLQEQVRTSVLDAREKMHEQMTADEWTRVFRAVSEE
jgi:uncharacterized membrane-anchored protein YhcB (DUF1043 family)